MIERRAFSAKHTTYRYWPKVLYADRRKHGNVALTTLKNPMKRKLIVTCTTTLFAAFIAAAAAGAGEIRGQVTGAGAPIANSTVTLWAATAGAPKQLGQTRTGADGSFALNASATPGDATLYLVAKGGRTSKASGDNPAIALMTVLGSKPRPKSRSTR